MLKRPTPGQPSFVSDEAWLVTCEPHIQTLSASMRKTYRMSRMDAEDLQQDLRIKAISLDQRCRQPEYWYYSRQALNNFAIDQIRKWRIHDHRYPGYGDDKQYGTTSAFEAINGNRNAATMISILTPVQFVLVTAFTGIGAKPLTNHKKLARLASIPVEQVQPELDAAFAAMRQLVVEGGGLDEKEVA